MNIWLLVKRRLGLQNDDHCEVIQSYIEEMEKRILHYCGISHMPKELQFVWASMVIDVVRAELAHIDDIAKTADRGESIKVGDTSSAPADKGGVTNMSKSVLDNVVLNYRVDLNPYRKLRW